MLSFAYDAHKARIILGSGMLEKLPEEMERLGLRKALILSTAAQRPDALRLQQMLQNASAGIFCEAAMHTPVDVTARAVAVARSTDADGIVAIGGGSTTGLSKAIALRTGLPQIVIATTYAGSEVTPILGQTESGIKTTIRDPRILPDVVIYDPDLTLTLPVSMSVNSGLNAIAHAIEGLYARDRNPVSSLMAVHGIRALHAALPKIRNNPGDREARAEALLGSWLCGTVLGTVGMALHHKLCHTLGGSFDLPHAETHAVLLPHTVAYNAEAAAAELAPLHQIFGPSIAGGLHDFCIDLGAPRALADLGLTRDNIAYAAELTMSNPYWNPCPLDQARIRQLLDGALSGGRPN